LPHYPIPSPPFFPPIVMHKKQKWRLNVQLNYKMLSVIEYLLYYGGGLKKLLVSNNYACVVISSNFEISNK
jgi:hypothetical protein